MRSGTFVAAVGALTLLAAANTANAGFFDQLFGGSHAPVARPPEVPEYLPPGIPFLPEAASNRFRRPSAVDLRRRDAEKKAAEAARRAAAQKRAAEQAVRDKRTAQKLIEVVREQGAMAAFLLDPTLRKGDFVVTESGIRQFEGATKASRHAYNDFRPLRGASKQHQQLMALQTTSGLNATERTVAVIPPRSLTVFRKGPKEIDPADLGSQEAGTPRENQQLAQGSDGGQ